MSPAWIFLALGSAAFSVGVYRIVFGYLSLSWPTVRGEVVSGHVEMNGATTGKGSTRSARVKVSYRYRVNGTEYTGSRFCFGGGGSSTYAEAMLDLHRETTRVDISYSRLNPSFSVVQPGIKKDSMLVMLVGLFFLVPFLLNIF